MAELIPLPRRRDLDPLWRHVLGGNLRRFRHERGETLIETADRAGVSPQYLSEMERGLKEPSSEMVAAVLGALGLSLLDLTVAVADELRDEPARAEGGATLSAEGATVRASLTLVA